MSKSKDNFFDLLVNISASSESSIDRISSSLKVFVRKYFDNHDYSEPENTDDLVLNCIMKVEAILYTVYELEPEAVTEEAKLELLYYKDLVMKTLVVITNLDFFVKSLKENHLFNDAYDLREKVKTEFRLEAAKLKQDLETGEFLRQDSKDSRFFKDVKPTEYRKLTNRSTEPTPVSPSKEPELPEPTTPKRPAKKPDLFELPTIDLGESDEKLLKEIESKPFSPVKETEGQTLNLIEGLKKEIKKKSVVHEPKTDKDGNKILRTAMGWEIPTDFLENGLYSD
jgi:hypothetical protein